MNTLLIEEDRVLPDPEVEACHRGAEVHLHQGNVNSL